MKKVYLGGPIYGVADPRSWRAVASVYLPKGWQIVDPTVFEVAHLTCEQLVKLDLHHLKQCNALLVRAEQASWGTAMEIFYAHQQGIPVLAWPCYLERAPWLTAHVTEFFSTLEDAMQGLAHVK